MASMDGNAQPAAPVGEHIPPSVLEKNSAASATKNKTLVQDFLNQHKKSEQMVTQDISASSDARHADLNLVALLNNPHASKAAIAKAVKKDMQGDLEAAGTKGHPGDDAKNAAQDLRVAQADERVLASGHLSPATSRAVELDKKLHEQDAKYSKEDIPNEQRYGKDDQAYLQALKTGKGIEAAKAQVIRDRQEDIANEAKYVKNDKAMKKAQEAVMKHFGHVAIG